MLGDFLFCQDTDYYLLTMNKLYRIRKGKIFFGVCGGLAKCFNVDAKIVRLLFTVTVFVFPKIIIAYIILMIVIPKEVKIR